MKKPPKTETPEVENLARRLYRMWWGASWPLTWDESTEETRRRWRKVSRYVLRREARIRRAVAVQAAEATMRAMSAASKAVRP